MTTDDLQAIGDVATRFGVAVSALRYYDELGILEPAERRGSGRHYGDAQLRRLALIQLLQGGGLSLEEIAELLAGPDAGRPWSEVLARRLEEIDRQLARMQAARATLAHLIECPDRDPIRECPVLAGMLEERAARAGASAP